VSSAHATYPPNWPAFLRTLSLDYNLNMAFSRPSSLFFQFCICVPAALLALYSSSALAQQPPVASVGRMLLLPRTIVSGERATLAVLDVNGRLTPDATVIFSNGDQLVTDATGRALFVAPLNPGVITGSISGRVGRVPVNVLPAGETTATAIEVESIPKIASLTDRLEINGRGFCGDADANQVTIAGDPAFVLASSPTSLLIIPPPDLPPGRASVDLSCGKLNGPALEIVFVALDLEADSSPLAPGVHRDLTVRVRGTREKVRLEAKNLAPDTTDLTGGNPARVSSSGGSENLAHFEVIGRKRGSFLISIRLLNSAPRAH
jgi:hypothetical protein